MFFPERLRKYHLIMRLVFTLGLNTVQKSYGVHKHGPVRYDAQDLTSYGNRRLDKANVSSRILLETLRLKGT